MLLQATEGDGAAVTAREGALLERHRPVEAWASAPTDGPAATDDDARVNALLADDDDDDDELPGEAGDGEDVGEVE
eukprot:1791232-Prymnesium_polylepis.1